MLYYTAVRRLLAKRVRRVEVSKLNGITWLSSILPHAFRTSIVELVVKPIELLRHLGFAQIMISSVILQATHPRLNQECVGWRSYPFNVEIKCVLNSNGDQYIYINIFWVLSVESGDCCHTTPHLYHHDPTATADPQETKTENAMAYLDDDVVCCIDHRSIRRDARAMARR